jgi:hypothetical protein
VGKHLAVRKGDKAQCLRCLAVGETVEELHGGDCDGRPRPRRGAVPRTEDARGSGVKPGEVTGG